MSINKKNTTGRIRAALADALTRAMDGNLSAEDGRNVIGLANQISQSMAVEVKVMTMKNSMGHHTEKFGELEIQ